MYPRNAASPPEISVGSLVSTTDGSLATTGASVRVKSGGSWAAGAGTLSCDATSGIWSYVPTQGETNASHFIIAVYRSGHVSIERTVVTTVSDVAGYAGLDWSQVRAASSTLALTGTTISASQVVASVSGAVGSVTGSVGSVTGSVGSVTSPVTVGTNNDKTGYSLATAPPTAATIADAVWDEIMSTHTVNGSYGSHVVRSANQNQNTVAITGSQHIAADVHELQAAVITADKFAANWLTAAGTAADYITELQTAIGTAANQTAILDRVSFCLSALAGNCSDAQTATETYVLSIGGNTYTVDYSGLDASGNRSTTTLSKA